MFTATFWKDTAERVVSTFAQTLIAVLSVDGLDWLEVDAGAALATAGGAALLSLLKALAASKVHNPQSASLVDDTPGRHAADR